MPYEVLVAEEFWKRLEKVGDRALGERLVKALRKLADAPRERGELLVGVDHAIHGRARGTEPPSPGGSSGLSCRHCGAYRGAYGVGVPDTGYATAWLPGVCPQPSESDRLVLGP